MIILGIDPGTATTGYGVIRKIQPSKEKSLKNGLGFECLEYNVIKTDPLMTAAERLNRIHIELNKVFKKHQPTVLAIESLFFFRNLKTVMPVSQARGVILMTAAKKKVPVYEFTPLQMKMTVTGYGRAEKDEVQEMIKRILDLKEIPKPDDAADALGIAICYALRLNT
ncbi:MAG: crossover junction endodeoxyribonuclease RuvC [Candidatus Portnoybacteria bacterium]|nr:crossover junction endodeoxyribonuclease RuvC [Candidatus Portnoybacteria bacterium]